MKRALVVFSVLALACWAAAQQQTKPAPEQSGAGVQHPESRPIETPATPATNLQKLPEWTHPQRQFLPEIWSPGATGTTPPTGKIRISPEVLDNLKKGLTPRSVVTTLWLSPVCYAMNSYVFARENGGDAMRLVDHTTCVPSERFSVKNAVQRVR